MSEQEPLPVGIVGCGRVSSKHLDALNGPVTGARLAAVCDWQVDPAEAAGHRYHVPWFTDSVAMLRTPPEIKMVCVLTPSGAHVGSVVALAPYGVHFVVEKPLALSLVDAEKMVRVMSES